VHLEALGLELAQHVEAELQLRQVPPPAALAPDERAALAHPRVLMLVIREHRGVPGLRSFSMSRDMVPS